MLNILSKQNMKICYYETLKTVNTKNIYGMLLCCKEKANTERENYTANRNGNQFVVCLHVLNFVIDDNTINIPKNFGVHGFPSLTVRSHVK